MFSVVVGSHDHCGRPIYNNNNNNLYYGNQVAIYKYYIQSVVTVIYTRYVIRKFSLFYYFA
jgi:hypothetical protein